MLRLKFYSNSLNKIDMIVSLQILFNGSIST